MRCGLSLFSVAAAAAAQAATANPVVPTIPVTNPDGSITMIPNPAAALPQADQQTHIKQFDCPMAPCQSRFTHAKNCRRHMQRVHNMVANRTSSLQPVPVMVALSQAGMLVCMCSTRAIAIGLTSQNLFA